jgi:tetratricopeptide (TPR) repeat protein
LSRGAARAALLLALAACGRGDAAGGRAAHGGADALPPEVRARVDSGNAAYRARDFQAALRHFREAARLDPGQAVSWYGVQMAAGALGDQAAADSAAARLRALAPSSPPALHHPGAAPAPPPPAKAAT